MAAILDPVCGLWVTIGRLCVQFHIFPRYACTNMQPRSSATMLQTPPHSLSCMKHCNMEIKKEGKQTCGRRRSTPSMRSIPHRRRPWSAGRAADWTVAVVSDSWFSQPHWSRYDRHNMPEQPNLLTLECRLPIGVDNGLWLPPQWLVEVAANPTLVIARSNLSGSGFAKPVRRS